MCVSLDGDDLTILHGNLSVPRMGLRVVWTANGFGSVDHWRTQARRKDGHTLTSGDRLFESLFAFEID